MFLTLSVLFFLSADQVLGVHRCLIAIHLLVFQVEFSSLDFLLHTKALLSTITYLTGVVPPKLSAARDRNTKQQVEKSGKGRTGECLLTGVSE